MIKKIRRSSQAEALRAIKEEVHHLPDTKPHSIKKVKQRSDDHYSWYICEVDPKELSRAKWVELYHYHDGFDLMKPGEELQSAVERYLRSSNLHNTCSTRIESIREEIREGKKEDPIFIEVINNGLLDYIDGFHREVAWLLEKNNQPLKAYVAYAKRIT